MFEFGFVFDKHDSISTGFQSEAEMLNAIRNVADFTHDWSGEGDILDELNVSNGCITCENDDNIFFFPLTSQEECQKALDQKIADLHDAYESDSYESWVHDSWVHDE